MARQAFWKGYLKLSLVTASVSLTPATTESNKVRFHVLNRQTRNRVESRYVDSVTHRAVSDKEQAKGYPKGEDDYVILEDKEIEEVGLRKEADQPVEALRRLGCHSPLAQVFAHHRKQRGGKVLGFEVLAQVVHHLVDLRLTVDPFLLLRHFPIRARHVLFFDFWSHTAAKLHFGISDAGLSRRVELLPLLQPFVEFL